MTTSDAGPVTGYVLHTRKYHDTSLIVEFFSRDQGRCSLLFKGIRRQQKKQLSHRAELHLFRKLSVQRLSRGELAAAKILENLGDYASKHHNGAHHRRVRPFYLHTDQSPRLLPRAARPSERRGCVRTRDTLYVSRTPLPRIIPA